MEAATDSQRISEASGGIDTAPVPSPAEKPGYQLPSFELLKERHHALMAEYLQVLDAAAALSAENAKFWATWRRGTRLWVGSHLRARTLLMAKLYAQLRLGCDDTQKEMANWLTESREACTQFAESLYSLRLPGAFALLAPALSVGAAVAKVPLDVVVSFAGFGVYVLPIPFTVVSSFRQKRELLLPGARDLDKGRTPTAEDRKRNAYKAEKEFFSLFARPAPRELSADQAVQLAAGGAAATLLFTLVIVIVVPQAGFSESAALPIVSLFVGPLVGWALGWVGRRFFFRLYDRREWR